jgi:hypothetical protein
MALVEDPRVRRLWLAIGLPTYQFLQERAPALVAAEPMLGAKLRPSQGRKALDFPSTPSALLCRQLKEHAEGSCRQFFGIQGSPAKRSACLVPI